MTREIDFNSEELAFLAEEELIHILPSFTEPTIQAITGDFGPFTVGVPIEVPLWLALRLKRDQQCRIQPPSWMKLDYLSRAKAFEKDHDAAFGPLPFHYIEVSRLLLSGWAREDVEAADAVESLLDDIELARREKMQVGVDLVLKIAASRDTPRLVDLTHASSLEVNTLRHTFFRALDRIVEAGEMQLAKDRQQGARGGAARGAGSASLSASYAGAGGSSAGAGLSRSDLDSSRASVAATGGSAAGGSSLAYVSGEGSGVSVSAAVPQRRLPLKRKTGAGAGGAGAGAGVSAADVSGHTNPADDSAMRGSVLGGAGERAREGDGSGLHSGDPAGDSRYGGHAGGGEEGTAGGAAAGAGGSILPPESQLSRGGGGAGGEFDADPRRLSASGADGRAEDAEDEEAGRAADAAGGEDGDAEGGGAGEQGQKPSKLRRFR